MRRSQNPFVAYISESKAIYLRSARSTLLLAALLRFCSPEYIQNTEMNPDSPASPVSPPVTRTNVSIQSIPSPVPPPAMYTAAVADVSFVSRLSIADLVGSSPGLGIELGDLPAVS